MLSTSIRVSGHCDGLVLIRILVAIFYQTAYHVKYRFSNFGIAMVVHVWTETGNYFCIEQ